MVRAFVGDSTMTRRFLAFDVDNGILPSEMARPLYVRPSRRQVRVGQQPTGTARPRRRSRPDATRAGPPRAIDGRGERALGAQTGRRLLMARPRVTSSAYSRSPPTGKPYAMRLTGTSFSPRCLARYMAVASPSTVVDVANTTSA